jgi:phosphoglycerol transferase MdoB-like AlkP superfamily enzyme
MRGRFVPALSRIRALVRCIGSDRFGPLYFSLFLFVAVCTATRVVLSLLHADDIGADWPRLFPALGVGFLFDVVMGLLLAAPFALFLLVTPSRWFAAAPLRIAVSTVFFAHLIALFYLAASEIVFFEEFTTRFNFVAVDYLIYPKEVFVNIRDSYPVGWVLAADLVLSAALFLFIRRALGDALAAPALARRRWQVGGAYAALLALGAAGLDINLGQVSDNRVVNELAGNGVYSFLHALVTNEVKYDGLYAHVDNRLAFERARRLIATDRSRYLNPDDPYSLDRAVSARGSPKPMNVVLVLEESLGSLFVGSLHPEGPSVMQSFDRLARDGLLFTRIYATGNRTVRGIEATLTSLPPMPGRSVVKRDSGRGLFTLPSVLKDKGYQTAFFYGGYSYFDNIQSFALANGFERVVDQSDFKKISFTTVWGVCDEDLFDNTLSELDRMHADGKPFFATVLTVSNHPPYTFPKGRVAEDPAFVQKRENAMRYADYAIGKFMRDAREHAFFENTLFVFLGDHGARMHGKQEIPLASYEVPVLFYSPKLIPQGRRVDTLGSQMDVAPTILGILQFDYRSRFFGRDLLNSPPGKNRALMTHNRDIALLRGDKLAVLGVRGTRELWRRDPVSGDLTRLPEDADVELMDDAVAYYQSAVRLYEWQRLGALAQEPLTPLFARSSK